MNLIVRVNGFGSDVRVVEDIITDHQFDVWGSIPYVESIGNSEFYILVHTYEDSYIFTDILDDFGINYVAEEID